MSNAVKIFIHNGNTNSTQLQSLFYFSEISRLQAGGSKGAGFKDPIKYVDVYRERPIRLTVRVLVPVREHPKVSRSRSHVTMKKHKRMMISLK